MDGGQVLCQDLFPVLSGFGAGRAGTGLGAELGAARAGVNYAELFLETSQISPEREINLPVWANNTPFFFFPA